MKKKKKEFNLDRYIFGALRKIWRWDPERKVALKRASCRSGKFYACEQCSGKDKRKVFTRKGVHVDHIIPAITPELGFTGWNRYINKLFVKSWLLQILCKKCHAKKTKAENALRKKRKKRKKRK